MTKPRDGASPAMPWTVWSDRFTVDEPENLNCANGSVAKLLYGSANPETTVIRIVCTRRIFGPPLSESSGAPNGTLTCTQHVFVAVTVPPFAVSNVLMLHFPTRE